MLNYFFENDLVLYAEQQPKDWKEAIKVSCEKLEQHGYATKEYADSIISSVNEFGPYIVLLPGVAMPHAAPTSAGVEGTGISLTVFKDEVAFEDDQSDEVKKARLFFTIVADDNEKHLNNITMLTDVLQNEKLLEELLKTESIKDFENLLNNYVNVEL